jgi:hypothetical protein
MECYCSLVGGINITINIQNKLKRRRSSAKGFRCMYLASCTVYYPDQQTYKIYIYIYLTAIGLTPGGSSTVHIYTQTVHRIQRTEHT